MSTNNKEAAEREHFRRLAIAAGFQSGWVNIWLDNFISFARSALAASEVPAITEQAPPMPMPEVVGWSTARKFSARQIRERDAMWMAKIAALRSEPTSKQSLQVEQAPAGEVPMDSSELNDACWSFIEAMPHPLPSAIWSDLKPAVKAAIEKYGAALSTPPAVPPELTPMLLMNAAFCCEPGTGDFVSNEKRQAIIAKLLTAAEALKALSTAPAAPQGEQPK